MQMRNSNHIVVTDNLLNTILVADAKATHPRISEARIVRVAAINAMTFAQRGDEVKRLNLDVPKINNNGCA